MALAAPGVGSNLDVNSIVTQLMNVERQPVAALDTKEASFQAKLSAYGVLRGSLSAFQSAVTSLSTASSKTLFSASSSDSAVLSAAANASAAAGSYAIDVAQLAQSQSLVAAGRTSASSAIGSGASTTLTFVFGTISGGTATGGVYTGASFTAEPGSASSSVTIDSTNNSLQGIRDAINSADIGVRASIIKDGSSSPYRLVLQAASGASHSMRIAVSGDADLSALLSHDPSGTQNLVETAAARDAQLTVNGVPVTSTTNSVADIVDGVTIKLLKEGESTLTLARDTSALRKAVDAFVKAYNELDGGIRALTKYDPQTRKGGALLGDGAARTIQAEIRKLLGSPVVSGTSDGADTLSAIGISFQRDGSLLLDSSKLDDALSKDYEAVAAMFGSIGKSNDSLVGVTDMGPKTRPGSYAVNITSLATRASVVGSAASSLTITTGSNDRLDISVDGTSVSVTIPPATYTAASLASTVQSLINGSSSPQAAGSSVELTEAAGVLTIKSNRFGSASTLSVSGSAASGLFGGAPTSNPGADVAGTIDGLPATGSGQLLTGQGGTDVDGLVLEITGGSTGTRGTVTVGNGYGKALGDLISAFLGGDGVLSSRTDGINRSIQDIGKRRDALNARLDSVEKRYRAQFTALDSLISNMNATSTFLAQQLAKLSSSS
jgi:flagellar hook-associated protein 2